MNLTQNKPLLAVLILFLAALVAWGSREKYWSKTILDVKTENSKLTIELASQKSQTESLQKDSETTEVMEPVVVKVKVDGVEQEKIVYVTRKSSKTVETAMRSLTEQIAQTTTENKQLKMEMSSKEVSIVKSAPRWYLGVDWNPFRVGLGAFAPELGMNVGPFLAKAGHPFELKFDEQGRWIPEPHVGIGLRF